MQCVVYSHSGDVFTGEGIGGVANQQTGLTHSPEEEARRKHEYKLYQNSVDTHTVCVYAGLYVCVCKGRLLFPFTVPHRHWPTFMLPEAHSSPL